MLYHGSHNPNLTIDMSACGTGSNCSGLFFTESFRLARDYGEHVYCCETPENYFENSDVDTDILSAMLAEIGIDYEAHEELCWNAIVRENMRLEELEEWAVLVKKNDIDYASWYAQELRIELARRQGFTAVGMNDECGSICILREHVQLERCTVEEEEEW